MMQSTAPPKRNSFGEGDERFEASGLLYWCLKELYTSLSSSRIKTFIWT
ncbi:MAG: hypothetical protein ACREPR_26415 [Brasilonema sp.]